MDPLNNSTSSKTSDAWFELQAFKTRQLNRKEKLNRHKRPYDKLSITSTNNNKTDNLISDNPKRNSLCGLKTTLQDLNSKLSTKVFENDKSYVSDTCMTISKPHSDASPRDKITNLSDLELSHGGYDTAKILTEKEISGKYSIDNGPTNVCESIFDIDSVECLLLLKLCDVALKLPVDSESLFKSLYKIRGLEKLTRHLVVNLLQKFAHQELITIDESSLKDRISDDNSDDPCIFIIAADNTRLVEFDRSLGSLDNLRALLNESHQSKQEEADSNLKSIEQRITHTHQNQSRYLRHSDVLDSKASDRNDCKPPLSNELIKKNQQYPGRCYNIDSNLNNDLSNFPSSHSQNISCSSSSKDDVESLLSLYSTKEKESKKFGEELLELLSKPTAKEKNLLERFQSADGYRVQEFCPKGTKDECRRCNNKLSSCTKLHFKKIIAKHTEETLGDCSFLNTCFHMDSCKYVHYEVDYDNDSLINDFKRPYPPNSSPRSTNSELTSKSTSFDNSNDSNVVDALNAKSDSNQSFNRSKRRFKTIICPPQWIQCDLRYFDMSLLGKFSVVMADPPWDIHMELPYGTMSDDEMRKLNIPTLQDEGVIFLWVTGRAMELGRECLSLWGYDRVDEIIWVKTNQLQRIIRTGRTGHWLNHGKEHCLVGIKGNPRDINRGLDCDVIVAEVRATSHKPDEIYGIIERLSPGTRKIELFARQHNIQPNWLSVGNQIAGVHLVEPELISTFKKVNKPYEDSNVCL